LRALRLIEELTRTGQKSREIPVSGDITLSPDGAPLGAALAGLGVTLLPNYLTAPEIDTGAWLIYPSRSVLPAKTRAMIDFLSAALPRAPAFV
jgi:DNA-binding transcriptional LysR family regulator